jgi:hypothetical protein
MNVWIPSNGKLYFICVCIFLYVHLYLKENQHREREKIEVVYLKIYTSGSDFLEGRTRVPSYVVEKVCCYWVNRPYLKRMGSEGVDWLDLVQDTDWWWGLLWTR